jgi:hypothetical protein
MNQNVMLVHGMLCWYMEGNVTIVHGTHDGRELSTLNPRFLPCNPNFDFSIFVDLLDLTESGPHLLFVDGVFQILRKHAPEVGGGGFVPVDDLIF